MKLILVFIILPTITLYPQEVRFKHLTINDGLSQNAVFAILQDSKGFMWFGTKDGLNRYDGYSFTVFNHNPFDTTTISANYITALFEDTYNRIWIGTIDGGINIFSYKTGLFYRLNFHDANNEITSITEDADSNIWIGTNGNGLIKIMYDVKKENYTFKIFLNHIGDISSLSNNSVTSLFIDSNKTLWIGTVDKLNRFNFDKENFTQYSIKTKNPKAQFSPLERSVLTLYEDKKRRFWLGTLSGLVLFDRQSGNYKLYPHHFDVYRYGWGGIDGINEDAGGNLWLSTAAEVMKFNPEKKSYDYFANDPFNPQSLSYNIVSSLFCDRTGILWFGTSGGGIDIYDPKANRFSTFVREKVPSSRISGFSVRSVLEDDNFVWVSTDFLYRWNRKTGELKSYETSSNNLDAFGNTGVWSMIKSSDEKIWTATTEGLYRYDPLTENVMQYKFNSKNSLGLPQNQVFNVFEDRDKNIWGVTEDFFSKLIDVKKGIFKNYRYQQSSPTYERVHTVVYQDNKKRFWLGTKNGLLLFIETTGSITSFKNNPSDSHSLNNNLIKTICPDPYEPDKVLWIGTAGGGLNRFDIESKTFTHFTEKEGLPNNVVYGILPDKNGNLWLSTNKGLSRYNIQAKTFRNFNVEDGLQSNEFNTGAYYLSNKGEMFFGGIYGLNYFYSDEIKDNPFKPEIVLTGFKILNSSTSSKKKETAIQKTISVLKEITLSYDEDFIQIEFAALDYSSPEKNQYSYKLENFNDDWIYSGTVRTATYTNLSPGEYLFRVKGTNNDGIWNETGAAIKLIITPPWWSTWWAYILYGLSTLAILYLIRRYELNRINLKNQLKFEKEESEELETVDRLVRVINRAEDMENLFNSLLEQTMSYIPQAEKAAVFLLSKKDNLFRVAYTAGYEVHDLEKISFTPDELRKRYTENSNEAEKGIYILSDTNNLFGDEKLIGFGKPKSMLVMAVEQDNVIEAYVVFDSFFDKNPFDNSAARLLNRFREHAVSAILKAQAIKTLQEKNEEIIKTQEQLITQQKLASLGALTAGIAHEIKNPLNFVNNFSEISKELIDEMKTELLNNNNKEAILIAEDLKQNLEKINHHGRRADSIVKGMLLHSRGSSGEKTLTNINDLLDQYVNLAYHGMRAQNKEFNITIEKDYDKSLERINVIPQDISRVFLNIINNACYAAYDKKKKSSDNNFSPILSVSTKNLNGKVEIRIGDNGNGIPKDILDKIFQPFFTTKPTGEGTGLGLSLSYDIVTKVHGGELKVETKEGEGSVFIISFPKS